MVFKSHSLVCKSELLFSSSFMLIIIFLFQWPDFFVDVLGGANPSHLSVGRSSTAYVSKWQSFDSCFDNRTTSWCKFHFLISCK